MPAEESSAIPAALIQLTHANSLQETEAPHLLAYLATISDPRGRRGRRHPLVVILAMAAMEHATRRVPAQRAVNGAPGEVPGFQPLLADLDLAGAVVTADALHAHAEAAQFLVTTKRADYLFTVKADQPTLLNRCARLAWQQVPLLERTRHRAHGRVEIRTLKAVTVRLGVGIPSQVPGDDARAAPDSATSKPTSLAERRAGGLLRSQTSGTQPSPTLPGRAIPEQPGNLDGLLP